MDWKTNDRKTKGGGAKVIIASEGRHSKQMRKKIALGSIEALAFKRGG